MIKPSGRRMLVFTAVALAAVSFGAVAYANHAWGNYHWARTSNPFTLKIYNNTTTASWTQHFNTAVTDWDKSSVINFARFTGTSSKRCAMVAGTVQVCNGTYGFNGWLGLASINISGSHITQGSAKMNDSYFNLSTYNNPNEKLHVMCQEIGHTFGLGHTSEDGSSQNTCMDYFSNTGANATSTTSTHPNQHDYDMLSQIYAHLDSTTTLAATSTTAAGRSEVTDDPNSWGALVSQSANGRGSVYERYNSDGSKTVTHVYWTEEAAARGASSDHRYDHHDEHR